MDLSKIVLFLLLAHLTIYTSFVALGVPVSDSIPNSWNSIINFNETALNDNEINVVSGNSSVGDLVYQGDTDKGVISGTLIYLDNSLRAVSGWISFLVGFLTMPMELMTMIGLPGVVTWIIAPMYYILMIFGVLRFIRSGF